SQLDGGSGSTFSRRRRSVLAAVRFLMVGGLSTVTTVGLFNILVHGGALAVLSDRPITAYTIGVAAGLIVNYLGNRFWTFDAAAPDSMWRHLTAFVVANAVALAIPAVCLGVSRYVLGLSSLLADNVAANVVGLALGTFTRWLLYRRFVFPAR
ncbi:GtrA family protein, partial [Mumia sp.]|uniref:GtrA family protein n=1 Tax=Mumia sp. TaxID=1965300 RepID=UPI0026105476